MYGKLFGSMYDGTISANWQGLVTFQQMIILCDADGTIDMTPPAMSRRTGIPLDILEAGIEYLESPDPYSRTPEFEGRRIVRLDDHRPWGWFIVNHQKYKMLQDSDHVRALTKERVRKHREKKKDVTVGNGQKRHTDTDTDTYTKKKKTSRFAPPSLDEIKAFIKKKNYSVNADSFISHYESNGWMVGKNKMKDWQAAIRGWESRDKGEKTGSRATLPRIDEQLSNWAERNGFPRANAGETFPQYRGRLNSEIERRSV